MGRDTPEDTAAVRSGDGASLELYLRSLAPGGALDYQERILERLDALVEKGSVDGYAVHLWGDRVCPRSVSAATGPGRFVLDRLAAFERWGEHNDVEVTFEREMVCSAITGAERETVRLPATALAEFRDGDLVFVAPCVDDGVPYAAVDRLDDFAADRATPRWEPEPVARPPAVATETSGTPAVPGETGPDDSDWESIVDGRATLPGDGIP